MRQLDKTLSFKSCTESLSILNQKATYTVGQIKQKANHISFLSIPYLLEY